MPEIPLPIKGFHEGFPVDKTPQLTSGYMNNVRGIGVLEKKVRICQRPGLDKVYTQQIAGLTSPVVGLCQVTIVEFS